jgi:hypothetical protein
VGAGRRRTHRCRLSGDSWEVASWSTCQRLLPDLLAVAEHAARLDVVTGGLLHHGVVHLRGQSWRLGRWPSGPDYHQQALGLPPTAGDRHDELGSAAWRPGRDRALPQVPFRDLEQSQIAGAWCPGHQFCRPSELPPASWRPCRGGACRSAPRHPLLSRASAAMPTCRQQGLGCDCLDHPPVTHRLDPEAASATTGDLQDAPSPDPNALHRDRREVPGPRQLEVAPAVLGKARAVK